VEQNEPIGPFAMRRDAHVRVLRWRAEQDVDVLDAEHTGYERLAEPVTHRRRICFVKEPFAWLVLDSLAGRGEHRVESFLHLAPGGELRPADTERLRPRAE